MSRQLTVLDQVRIASPCTVPWSSMTGDERTRHCQQCNLNVFNLSELTRADAEALILKHQGRLCIRYYQRADGTILTQDCPIGLQAIRRRLARTIQGVAAGIAFLASSLFALATNQTDAGRMRLRLIEPFERIISWLEPQTQVMGRMGTIVLPAGSTLSVSFPNQNGDSVQDRGNE